MVSANPFRKTVFLGAALLASLSLLLVAGEAAAQLKKGGKGNQPRVVSNQELHHAIGVLRSAKRTLEKADHDYGGHRVAAIRDINKAIHQLQLTVKHGHKKGTGTKKGTGVKKGPRTGKGPRQPEPQAVSDAQLAQSIPVLKKTNTGLQHTKHDYGGHRARAVSDLRAAVHQLETALKYSRTRNKNKA